MLGLSSLVTSAAYGNLLPETGAKRVFKTFAMLVRKKLLRLHELDLFRRLQVDSVPGDAEFNSSTMDSLSTSGLWFAISLVKICGPSSSSTLPRHVASWS